MATKRKAPAKRAAKTKTPAKESVAHSVMYPRDVPTNTEENETRLPDGVVKAVKADKYCYQCNQPLTSKDHVCPGCGRLVNP